ncbi:Transcriptional regulator, IclR family [Frankia canadensis]|uniref:Transcriptional regulator, IclR family n=1 Tax=Frankia canadensis TaxID=1836972 RepID=A0A2I2KJD3_9ACTN|nr:helix-turn-helix domain-containing protein [Frankia canadensis]SNQ45765.1 Transcriptional regulator, IclR family [Frankia canadensis]SOU53055.1 Transcriptional regulator, IclR family [Frankia canadensis]
MSNPTRRVVALLDFLGRHPGRTYSLSELARELEISKSTLHALVETLVEAGYLIRHEDTKAIELGPVLAGIGHSALGRRGHLIDSLRPAMETIARTLDSHCLVSADIGDWIVPLAAAGEPSRVTTLFRVGGRSNPFAPPMGILFLPGRTMSEIHDWLGRARPALGAVEQELNLSAIDVLRTNGFAAAARLDAKARLERALDELHLGKRPEHSESVTALLSEMRRAPYVLLDFDDPNAREIDWIGVPLLDGRSRVTLALVVLNLPSPMSGPDVLKVARYLRASLAVHPEVRLFDGTGTATDPNTESYDGPYSS